MTRFLKVYLMAAWLRNRIACLCSKHTTNKSSILQCIQSSPIFSLLNFCMLLLANSCFVRVKYWHCLCIYLRQLFSSVNYPRFYSFALFEFNFCALFEYKFLINGFPFIHRATATFGTNAKRIINVLKNLMISCLFP